jgi:hypothetical protein
MTTVTVKSAELRELDATGTLMRNDNSPIPVQFNPETLKVTYANQVVPPSTGTGSGGSASGGQTSDQTETSSTQFVGRGTTKLAVQLWFDVSSVVPSDLQRFLSERNDVRLLTEKVAYYIKPKEVPNTNPKRYLPPAVSFIWGSFRFDGIVESLDESLEFFSPDGVPLRAVMSLSIVQQSFQFAFNADFQPSPPSGGGLPGGGAPGTQPLASASAGLSLQGMTASAGISADWQGIALANGIENPRILAPGQLINLNASASASASVSAPTASASASFRIGG